MKAKRLTTAMVERVKPPAAGRVDYFDVQLPGLGLRVSSKGTKSWTFMYRCQGKQRRQTFGRYPGLGLVEARREARKIMDTLDRREDPKAEVEVFDAVEATAFSVVAERFDAEYRQRKNTPDIARDGRSVMVRHILPTWGDREIASIRRRDVIDLLDLAASNSVAESTLNRILKEVRKLFSWAIEEGLVDASPVQNVRMPAPQAERDRVLTDIELAAIWNATFVIGYPFGPMVRLLMLTAQRRREAARATWSQFDLDRATWTIPAAHSKSRRSHVVPLAEEAMALIEALPRFGGGACIFSTTDGSKPVSGFSRAKLRLDQAMAETSARAAGAWPVRAGKDSKTTYDAKRKETLEAYAPAAWRFHDLRRTAASRMAEAGVRPEVLSRILNHAPRQTLGVTAIYNRYGYQAEMREALDVWSGLLSGIVRQGE